MVQPRHGLRLAVEPAADVLAGVQVRVEHLHRHDAAQLGIEATPDHGHSTLADLLLQPVAAKLQPNFLQAGTRVAVVPFTKPERTAPAPPDKQPWRRGFSRESARGTRQRCHCSGAPSSDQARERLPARRPDPVQQRFEHLDRILG